MRRRDFMFLCVIWAALLAGLMWALSTQFRWVQESKPKAAQPVLKGEEPMPPSAPAGGTGVIGEVSEDTMKALAKGLPPSTPKKGDPKASGQKASPPK